MDSRLFACGVLMAAVLATSGAQAVQVVSDTNPFTVGATVIDFNNFDSLLTPGALELGTTPGSVVLTSTPNVLVGADAQDLGQNGLWGARGTPVDGLVNTPTGSGNFLATAFTATRGEVGFSFAAPVAHVGAFFNQFQSTPTSNNTLRLTAFDVDGNEVESFSYRIDTAVASYNEGKFLGFSRSSADIHGLAISAGSFVMDNLTTAPVPEPSTYVLMAAGLLVVARIARIRSAS